MPDTGNYWTRLHDRSVSRRRFVVGSGVLAAGSAAILAGCGDDDDDPAPTSTGTATASASATGSATGSATASATATSAVQKGGTLRTFKLATDPGLDPAVYHLNNYEPVNCCYTQVMAYRASTNKFSMDGMVAFEQVDPLTITWKVRPGMKFHNGDPVTAEDWAYTMTRIPVITKERRGHTGTPLFNYIESVTATDELTATMKLTRPNPSTGIHMARQYFAFVNKKVTEAQPEKDVQNLPLGAGGGPYRLETRDGTGTKLVRNTDYFKHTPNDDGYNVDGPNIDAIETRILADSAAQRAAFLSGDLDILGAVDALDLDEYKKDDRFAIAEVPNPSWIILAFDHKKLFDKRARQAIRLALDYDAFVGSILAGKAVYQAPVNQVVTAFQPWDQAKIKSNYKFDPAEAKKLWEAAGSPVDTIRILTGNDGQPGVTVAEFAAKNLNDAGIKAEVIQVDSQTWAQRANAVPDKDWELLQSGRNGAGAYSGVPEDSQLIWFDPRAYGPLAFNVDLESPNPEHKAENVKLLDLLKKQEVELDVDARKVILAEIQQFIFDIAHTGALLPIAPTNPIAYSARMQDVTPEDWSAYYGAVRRQTSWLKA